MKSNERELGLGLSEGVELAERPYWVKHIKPFTLQLLPIFLSRK